MYKEPSSRLGDNNWKQDREFAVFTHDQTDPLPTER
jgi:hypothetical protein